MGALTDGWRTVDLGDLSLPVPHLAVCPGEQTEDFRHPGAHSQLSRALLCFHPLERQRRRDGDRHQATGRKGTHEARLRSASCRRFSLPRLLFTTVNPEVSKRHGRIEDFVAARWMVFSRQVPTFRDEEVTMGNTSSRSGRTSTTSRTAPSVRLPHHYP